MKLIGIALRSWRRLAAGVALALLTCSAALPQSEAPSSGGQVLGVIQWFTVVADLAKAERFYHGLMGLESVGAIPECAWGFTRRCLF